MTPVIRRRSENAWNSTLSTRIVRVTWTFSPRSGRSLSVLPSSRRYVEARTRSPGRTRLCKCHKSSAFSTRTLISPVLGSRWRTRMFRGPWSRSVFLNIESGAPRKDESGQDSSFRARRVRLMAPQVLFSWDGERPLSIPGGQHGVHLSSGPRGSVRVRPSAEPVKRSETGAAGRFDPDCSRLRVCPRAHPRGDGPPRSGIVSRPRDRGCPVLHRARGDSRLVGQPEPSAPRGKPYLLNAA